MTLAVQALTSMAMTVPAVLAPIAAADIGVEPARIGLWVGLAFFTAMLIGPLCGMLLVRYGPVRMFQAAAVCVALGLIAGALSHPALILACALLLGTAHGLVNPASSTILAKASPPRMRAMIFSIKQTGVPVGSAVAGTLVPALLLWTSWQNAVFALALVGAAFIVMVAPFRALYDRERVPGARLRLRGIAAPIAEVCADRPILALAITSGVYSAVQTGFVTYLILYLKLELGYTLVAAGLIFSAAQVAGVVGRVFWGAVADHWVEPHRVLAVLGVIMALCGIAAIFFNAAWPFAAITAVCMLYGATAVGWNGVYLAEVARLAPEGRVGIVTGGTQFFTFAGGLVGPPLFGAIASATGSFSYGFVFIAVLPLVTGLVLLATGKGARGRRATQ